MKRRKTIPALLLILAFAAGAAAAAEVAVTVEKFALGEGFIVEPALVTISDREMASEVILRLLESKFPGVNPYDYSGWGQYFYLSGVYDPARKGLLREKDPGAGEGSGWMITVDNIFINTSAGVHALRDGNVMRWQYTRDLGSDIGGSMREDAHASAIANRDALIWKLAEINKAGTQAEYPVYARALRVLSNLASTQAQVDSVLAKLVPGIPDDEPEAPDTPDIPDEPGQPGEPGEPEEPEEPEEPDIPDTPEEPQKPDAPDGTAAINPVKPDLPDAADVEAAAPVLVEDTKDFEKADIPSIWMTLGEGNSRVLLNSRARERAGKLWPGDVVSVEPLPMFSAASRTEGGVVAVGFGLKGSKLPAARADEVKVMKVLPEGRAPIEFRYDETGNGDGTFRVLDGNGAVHGGEILPGESYTLVLFIKDDGNYDLDKTAGAVLDPAVLVGVKTTDQEGGGNEKPTDQKGGGGGCDAGVSGAGAWLVFLAWGVFRSARKTRRV